MLLHRIIYFSEIAIPDEDDLETQLNRILNSASRRNARLGVTGALIVTNKHFIQVLEGGRRQLSYLVTLIGGDTRHKNFTLAQFVPADMRIFMQWRLLCMDASEVPTHYGSRYSTSGTLEPSLITLNGFHLMFQEIADRYGMREQQPVVMPTNGGETIPPTMSAADDCGRKVLV